jgi:hypothetical protein
MPLLLRLPRHSERSFDIALLTGFAACHEQQIDRAKRAPTHDLRQKYQVMADSWEALATERERRLKIAPEDGGPEGLAP